MSASNHVRRRAIAAVLAGAAGLAAVNTAGAVDLRDWGRKFPASERFVVLAQFNNQAVLDKETQLVWQRSPDTTLRQWETAEYECTRAAIGGRYGWRLPSRFEVFSLLDPIVTTPVKLPAGHPFIGIVPGSLYWTGDPTTVPDPDFYAYKMSVNVTTAAPINSFAASFTGRTWCVRGPGQ